MVLLRLNGVHSEGRRAGNKSVKLKLRGGYMTEEGRGLMEHKDEDHPGSFM